MARDADVSTGPRPSSFGTLNWYSESETTGSFFADDFCFALDSVTVRLRLDTRLPKGKYLLLCFIPDASGESHLKLGMVHPFTVR